MIDLDINTNVVNLAAKITCNSYKCILYSNIKYRNQKPTICTTELLLITVTNTINYYIYKSK